jgi:hypothetical protein
MLFIKFKNINEIMLTSLSKDGGVLNLIYLQNLN